MIGGSDPYKSYHFLRESNENIQMWDQRKITNNAFFWTI